MGNAQTRLPQASLHLLVSQGIELSWQQKYEEADSVFQEVLREFPNHPAGYIYRAGVMQSKALDYERNIDVPPFDSLIELGKNKAKAMIERGEDPVWGYFFIGTAEGYDSYARVYRGDWFGGLMRGLASVSAFKDALKADSAMYDACAGIGAFYYWRSRKTEHFNWLPFVGDDRPEAYVLLNKSVDHGLYNRYTALSMLVTIYIDAGEHEKAVEAARSGLQQCPANRTFLWGLATALHKMGAFPEAAQAYQTLLAAIIDDREKNHYNETVCRLNLAKVRMELGEGAEAKKQLETILRFREDEFLPHLKSRVQDKLEQCRLLLAKLSENR